MPELPEVEVIRRGLQRLLPGRRIEAVFSSGKPLRRPIDLTSMNNLLIGCRITEIGRRAKYLIISLDNGAVLLIHLGMTGRLGLFTADTPQASHDHLRWRLDTGRELRFNDTRRFGFALVFPAGEVPMLERTVFKNIGPEPFGDDCTADYLYKRARHRTQSIKAFLMDATTIAGVGNIYANECLFAAAIHPARPASELDESDWHRLLASLRDILTRAIDCGGSTISDYLTAGGSRGYFQFHFKVYGKDGEPCPQCTTPIEKIRLGGRASFFCPKCQERRQKSGARSQKKTKG